MRFDTPFVTNAAPFEVGAQNVPTTRETACEDITPALRVAHLMRRRQPLANVACGPKGSVEACCPRASSTRFTNLHLKERPFVPSTFNAGYCGDDHWTYTDPILFESLPQGGGGVDWLTISIEGELTEHGIALSEGLTLTKRAIATGERALSPYPVVQMTRRTEAIIELPNSGGVTASIAASSTGSGRAWQPHLLRVEGIAIRYGAYTATYARAGGKTGPVAFVEIPGLVFLERGVSGAMQLLDEVLTILGIRATKIKATRLDVCADLPGVSVQEFYDVIVRRDYIARSGGEFQHFTDRTGSVTSCRLQTGSTILRIYDKIKELKKQGTLPIKRELMVKNRLGAGCKAATRVEFQFNLSYMRALKFSNIEELFGGLSHLVQWATMSWFKCSEVIDRRHTERSVVSEVWLRTLHAFTWWTSHLRERFAEPTTILQPPEALIKQAVGCMASALARAGVYIDSDVTGWTVLRGFIAEGDLAEKVREKVNALRAKHGSTLHLVDSHVTLRDGSELQKEGKDDDTGQEHLQDQPRDCCVRDAVSV